jgi:hypothetical protein
MGVYECGLKNTWLACARFDGGPSTFLGGWFETKAAGEAAVKRYEYAGILPMQFDRVRRPSTPRRPVGDRVDIQICPERQGSTYCFYDADGKLIGICSRDGLAICRRDIFERNCK